MANKEAIVHLEALRQEARDEIKRRIEQRDKFSIQLSIALGAIIAVAFSRADLGKVLIAAPLVSIYFTLLIQYSYRIHQILASYLREELEPELARLCGTPVSKEWETYYWQRQAPGIRQSFFLAALWVVCTASLAYLWTTERELPEFRGALAVASPIYISAALVITAASWEDVKKQFKRLTFRKGMQ